MTKKNIQKIDNIKTRLLQYAEYKCFSRIDFYQKIDTSPSNFSVSQMQNSISSNKIVEILTIFPDLSAEWLLRGEGQMIKQQPDNTPTNEELINENKYLKRIVDVQAKLIAQYEKNQ